MTIKYNAVYINQVGTVVGPNEAQGPLKNYFDKTYNDFYFGEKTWEQAESKLISNAIAIILNKANLTKSDIDLFISGDLLNQITSSNYAASFLSRPYIGIYAACATSVLGLIIAANMIESKTVKKVICATSSHSNSAEKQFRYPVEYGGHKPKTATFTATGSAAALLSPYTSFIKIETATIGTPIDSQITDVYNMGAVMAKAAAETLYTHLKDLKRSSSYYDLILTGDLGIYGKKIFQEYLKEEYGLNLTNYNDSGTMLYDLKPKQYAGASGPACLPLVTYGYILDQMKTKNLKKVLLIATGSLHSQTSVNQKLAIPAVAHIVSLEAAK